MTLIEKLDLLNLSEEEKGKAREKFLSTLALVSEDELREVLSYLVTQGIEITKAREIKIVSNSKDEISKKFDILGEIHENELYRNDPLLLNKNVIDIYKKIKYCIQIGKSYKKADGSYEPFLFNENSWEQEINRENVTISDTEDLDDKLITVEPIVENEPVIKEFGETDIENDDTKELESEITNFSDIRKRLEAQLEGLKELDALNNSNDDVISFGDIEPEAYEMRRTA